MITDTNWEKLTDVFCINGRDYVVTADIFLEEKQYSDPYSRTGYDTSTAATLEGWDMLPKIPEDHPHYPLLEAAILAEMEERWPE